MILVTGESNNPAAQEPRGASSRRAKPLQKPAHHYVLAGQKVMFDAPVLALAAFQQADGVANQPAPRSSPIGARRLHRENADLQYHGVAPIAAREQQVSCWRDRQLLQLDVGGQAICQIDMRHRHIHLLNERPYDDRLNLEVVTGPALMLLLAGEGVFCLHAGAVATGYGNIALIAESGVGKSTLSAHQGDHWQQLADDIVPFMQHQSVYHVGKYPQLKLPGNTVAATLHAPAEINLVLRLCGEPGDKISFNRLNKTAAMLQIVRHSVAAKLFDVKQLQSHVAFARQLTVRTPVVELSYPRDLAQLEIVRTAISDYLRMGDAG